MPKGTDPAALTLDAAVALLSEKASGGGGGGRALGEHPSGGAVTVRAGRFGAYVNWGKVNATIPKSVSPDDISLEKLEETYRQLAKQNGFNLDWSFSEQRGGTGIVYYLVVKVSRQPAR